MENKSAEVAPLLLETHLKRFLNYAETFEHGQQKENIRLKIDHTLRVFHLAQRIAQTLDIPCKTQAMACLAALYHDIGRFPQYAKYRTFKDKDSVNHALLGVATLHKHALLADVAPNNRRLIYGAVGLHNKKHLPNLRNPLKTICQIVRDSDKLDIMPLLLKHLQSETIDPVIVMGAKAHPNKYTAALLQEINNGDKGDYSLVQWTNDCRILMANWIFDLHFPESYAIIHEGKYLEQALASLPNDAACNTFRSRALEHLHAHLAGGI